MSISAVEVHFDDDLMWLSLQDGRQLRAPIAWFPRLMAASAAEREAVEISPFGLHWEAPDEDISVPALQAGEPVLAAE